MKKNDKRLIKISNESGIAVIEYVLLLSVVVVGVYVALTWTALGTTLQAVIDDLITALGGTP